MDNKAQPPRVLIGIVTYDGHRHAIEKLLEAIGSVTNPFGYPHATVIFADNSAKDEYARFLQSKGFEVLKDSADGTRIDRIIRGRNHLRDVCLERSYDYLFFLDTDVIPPKDTLSRLLRHQKEVITGIYLGAMTFDSKTEILPVLYTPLPDGRVRTMRIAEVMEGKLIPIAAAGLGCCLIHRNVLEKLRFRNIAASVTGGEDAAFFKDVISLGVIPYADTSIKCFHMGYPEGDRRNEPYQFERYRR